MTEPFPTIAVLGGTGPQGSGLALRWAKAGYPVLVGGRTAEKCEQSAAELNAILGGGTICGLTNREAAEQADIVVLALPYAGQQETAVGLVDALSGKVVIDVTVPLVPPKVSMVQLPPGGSAAVALQAALGPSVRVVSAFQNISAEHLHDLEHEIDCDVLVCGDANEACETAMTLAAAAGMKAWRAGVLANSVVAEALTSVLIAINRRYKIAGSGIRVTGSPKAAHA